MSILQEYAWIKNTLRPGEFEAMEMYLKIHRGLLLSDLYYNEKHYNEFAAWWEAQKNGGAI